MWKSETSNYIFMAWKDSLEVLQASLLCLRYCSHTVSHRCTRKASADDSLSTTAKKRGWSSSCQLRGMCFDGCIFLYVLYRNTCIYRTRIWKYGNDQFIELLLLLWMSLSDIQKCQSALLMYSRETSARLWSGIVTGYRRFWKERLNSVTFD